MSSNIEQCIMEIEAFIDNCKCQPFSNTKIIVNKDELEGLVSDLRMNIPGEINKYKKIIANREAILNDAKSKAENMLREAQIQTSELISEHEIMQQAYIQANEVIQNATNEAQSLLDKATAEANEIRLGAMQYTDDILANIQNLLTYSVENFQTRYDSFISSVNKSLEIVVANREELRPAEENQPAENKEPSVDYEDYTVKLDE